MLSVMILIVVMLDATALNVVMLDVIILNVVMLDATTLNLVMLDVIMLNAVMHIYHCTDCCYAGCCNSGGLGAM